MHRRLILILLAALALALGPALLAQDAEVVVHMNDGRKLEGVLVSEDAAGIVLRMRVGAEVPIARADIKEIVKAAGPGADTGTGTGTDDEARVEIETVITLKDGAIIRGRATDKGGHYEVENDLGTVRVEKKLVRATREEKIVRGGAASGAGAAGGGAAGGPSGADREVLRDLGLGFQITRPGAAWTFADQAPDPLCRALLRRDAPLAFLRVAVEDAFAPEHREVDPAIQDKVAAALLKELKERWRTVRGLQVAADRYKGVPAWRVSYQADARVFASKYTFREIHLPRGEARLVLQGYCPLENEREGHAELDPALQSLSWIGPVADLSGAYLHYGLGIRVARPRAHWRLAVRLFDAERPVEVLPPDGRGRFRLEVAPAGAAATPQAAADAIEKSLGTRSRFFRKVSRVERNLSGVPAVDLKYQDQDEGTGAKVADCRRLILVREQRLIQFVAAVPADDPAAAPAVEALFEGIDALVEVSPAAVFRQGARAVELRVQGEKKLEENKDAAAAVKLLSQAVDAAPGYGRAYLVRGKAYHELGDFKRAVKDYDAADDLLDDPAIGRLVASAQAEQAKRIGREDFPEARKLLIAAIRNDPQGRAYKEELARQTLDFTRGLILQAKFETAIDALREAERRFPEDSRYRREAVRAHTEWARKLQNEDELYKARTVLKRAQRLDPENTSLKSLIDRLEQDIKKKEEGDPKKGGKKK